LLWPFPWFNQIKIEFSSIRVFAQDNWVAYFLSKTLNLMYQLPLRVINDFFFTEQELSHLQK